MEKQLEKVKLMWIKAMYQKVQKRQIEDKYFYALDLDYYLHMTEDDEYVD